ncbi:MAG: hypothetical protein WBB28_07360 [Crinalium sp.]
MNVPIHYHGTRLFMLGNVKKIQRLFSRFSEHVAFYKWGYPSEPILNVFPHPGYWILHNKPAYVLDIQAIKDRPLPSGYSNRGASSGRIAQLLTHPVSYNVYRALCKAGFFPKNTVDDEYSEFK